MYTFKVVTEVQLVLVIWYVYL